MRFLAVLVLIAGVLLIVTGSWWWGGVCLLIGLLLNGLAGHRAERRRAERAAGVTRQSPLLDWFASGD